jgi:NAD(P)-dependent dehydrogenase (short-subunit alcohol dehydrogenase family)
VDQIAVDEWNEVLSVNLTGAFLCIKYVVPRMIQLGEGRIINISSIAGKIAYPLRSAYVASKWGLVGLTMTLAKELAPYNITVNAVCPGPVEGERMRQVIAHRAQELGQTEDEVRGQYLKTSAMGRMVDEDDVASMVAFLASGPARNITGQAIDVAAGYAL